jgi:hypothetical protein
MCYRRTDLVAVDKHVPYTATEPGFLQVSRSRLLLQQI